MPIKLHYEIIGGTQLKLNMTVIRAFLKDIRKPLGESGDHMVKSINKNFDAEGRPIKWIPLTAFTIRDRIAQGFTGEHPILTRTHKLRDSIRKRIAGNTVHIGTGLHKASVLQRGGESRSESGSPVIIPARPFVMFNPEDPKVVVDIFHKHLKDSLKVIG